MYKCRNGEERGGDLASGRGGECDSIKLSAEYTNVVMVKVTECYICYLTLKIFSNQICKPQNGFHAGISCNKSLYPIAFDKVTAVVVDETISLLH